MNTLQNNVHAILPFKNMLLVSTYLASKASVILHNSSERIFSGKASHPKNEF